MEVIAFEWALMVCTSLSEVLSKREIELDGAEKDAA